MKTASVYVCEERGVVQTREHKQTHTHTLCLTVFFLLVRKSEMKDRQNDSISCVCMRVRGKKNSKRADRQTFYSQSCRQMANTDVIAYLKFWGDGLYLRDTHHCSIYHKSPWCVCACVCTTVPLWLFCFSSERNQTPTLLFYYLTKSEGLSIKRHTIIGFGCRLLLGSVNQVRAELKDTV